MYTVYRAFLGTDTLLPGVRHTGTGYYSLVTNDIYLKPYCKYISSYHIHSNKHGLQFGT